MKAVHATRVLVGRLENVVDRHALQPGHHVGDAQRQARVRELHLPARNLKQRNASKTCGKSAKPRAVQLGTILINVVFIGRYRGQTIEQGIKMT